MIESVYPLSPLEVRERIASSSTFLVSLGNLRNKRCRQGATPQDINFHFEAHAALLTFESFVCRSPRTPLK